MRANKPWLCVHRVRSSNRNIIRLFMRFIMATLKLAISCRFVCSIEHTRDGSYAVNVFAAVVANSIKQM